MNSSNLYDSGEYIESIRIATTLRVLFHDTKISKSLFTQLNLNGTKLISTYKTIPKNKQSVVYSKIKTNSQHNVSNECIVKQQQIYGVYNAYEWWEQEIICAEPLVTTRKQIVLQVANKEGGAHVDSTATTMLKKLDRGTTISSRKTFSVNKLDSKYLNLRLFAFEVLTGPVVPNKDLSIEIIGWDNFLC